MWRVLPSLLSLQKAARAQYHAFVADNPENVPWAQQVLALHEEQIRQSETKLKTMFAKADTDGDGLITHDEFLLAEAWWAQSAMNPTKMSLFG